MKTRAKVAIAVAIAVVVVVVGLVVGFAVHKKKTPSAEASEEADIGQVCAARGMSSAQCDELRVEWDASKRNALAACEAEHADKDARNACVEVRMTRSRDAADMYAEGAVYPETYAKLSMRVGSEDVCESPDGALVVGGGSPVFVRFVKQGSEWTIETPDAARVVVVAPGGALALAARGVAARFVATRGALPSSISLSPVARVGAALVVSAGASVDVKLVHPVGVPVEARLDARELATLQSAMNVAAIDAVNGSGCCVTMRRKCTGPSAAAQRERFPLCCGACADAEKWCAWKAAADASVLDETGDVARKCCASRHLMLDVTPDYKFCEKPSETTQLPGQYAAKCEPRDEHTFTFVPAGAWALAPNGVRVPAYGRVLFMRGVSAGYRGVRCARE